MLIDLVKKLLLKVVDDIDAGNSNINEDDANKIIECLTQYTRQDRPLSKYEACVYLGIARSTFDKYVALGKIPKGKHRAGFKEIYWTKEDLDNVVTKLKSK